LVKKITQHNNDEREAETGVQLKAKSHTFMLVDFLGVSRDVVKDMAGYKVKSLLCDRSIYI
jgi:hypothetical protein